MSRTIEQERIDSGDLTDDEMLYLAQRDQLPEDVRQDAEAQLQLRSRLQAGAPLLEDVPNTGTVNTLAVTKDQLAKLGIEVLEDDANPPEQFEGARLGQTAPGAPVPTQGTAQPPVNPDPEDLEDDDEDVEYTDMKNDELRAEIARRNAERDADAQLSLDGNKQQLISTLEADDASNAE